MATKRTTRTIGNRRYTTTTSSNGKTTRSESSAGKTKPGQTRITTTYTNGKTDTIRTTNLGNGWYQRTSSRSEDAKRRRAEKANRDAWKRLFGKKKTEGNSFFPVLLLCIGIIIAIKAFGN